MKSTKQIFKKTFLLTMLIFIILNVNNKYVLGAQVSFAISPSKIYDQQINLGESKEYVFNVANKSVGVTDESFKNMEITMESHLEDEYGEVVDNNIVTFDKESLTIKPEEVQKVTATVKIPNDMIQGNYKLSIDFVQAKMKGVFGEQTNVISVPIFVFAGTIDEYSKMKVDYSIGESYLSYNADNTTLFKESVKDCIKVLNPFNTISTIKDILYRPTYNFVKNKTDRIDINNDIYTNLEDVMTTRKRTSDFKYVHYEKAWLDKKIIHSSKSTNKIILTLEGDISLEIKGADSSLNEIHTQLSTIAQNTREDSLTLSELSKELIVPKSYKYAKLTPYLVTKATSYSDIPITLTGEYKTIKNNSKTILEGEIFSSTIAPNKTEEVKNLISKEDLTEGVYSIQGSFSIRDITKDFSYKFSATSLRYIVLIVVIIFMLIYYYIIYRIIKWLLQIRVAPLKVIIEKRKYATYIYEYVWNNKKKIPDDKDNEDIDNLNPILIPMDSDMILKFKKKPKDIKVLLNNEVVYNQEGKQKDKIVTIKSPTNLSEFIYEVQASYGDKKNVKYVFKIKTYDIDDNINN